MHQVTNETLVTIFQTILSWHLEAGGFPATCKQLGAGIISATLDIYSQSMAKLLPTPTKSHYTFNLRDFARVIQVLYFSCQPSQVHVWASQFKLCLAIIDIRSLSCNASRVPALHHHSQACTQSHRRLLLQPCPSLPTF